MDSNFNVIQQLLQERADYQARLNLIPYDGSPEIKKNSSGRYLYIRKRVNGKLTSTYVDIYSDELYQMLLRGTKEARELKKQIRRIDKELAANGYSQNELSADVTMNLDFARANMKSNIYNQALDKETIDMYSTGESRGNNPSYSINYQKSGKDLMTIDELAVMDGDKCILQLRGVRPFLSDKYDVTQHPLYKETGEFVGQRRINMWFYIMMFICNLLIPTIIIQIPLFRFVDLIEY